MKREHYRYDVRTWQGQDGVVIINGEVAALPYCPSGKCWRGVKGGRPQRVRVKRRWNKSYRHWESYCYRCGKVWSVWL